MNYIHQFLFGVYPYIAIAIFLLGCFFRFEKDQYSWKTESSQILDEKLLRIGNICFHIGVLGIFFGHLFGLLTPFFVWDFLGVTKATKQLMAITAGGVMGTLCLIGLLMLIYRRVKSQRLQATSSWRDWLVLIWLFVTLLLGMGTLPVAAQHLDGGEMAKLMHWAQHLVTFRGDAASFIADTSIIFKLHIFMGLTLFAIVPFTRLVHIFSGIGIASYLIRPWQIVRAR